MTAMAALTARVRDYASLVKLSHSVFALPFALLSLLAATAGQPSLRLAVLVVLAVVCARTAAMAYNRYADRHWDALNPRTQAREIPRGAVSASSALGLTAVASLGFLVCCWALAPVCLWLALPTLLWLLAYSHMKRWTALCHLWLGVALGIAPVAAWLAADGEFSTRIWAPLALGLGVSAWVAGFDILYACQDEEFDRQHGLYSLPARFGALRAMWLARGLHGAAFAGFAGFGRLVPMGPGYGLGVVLAGGFLVWQHCLLRPGELARINMAFFTANGTIALLLLAAGGVDLYWLRT
jgi:4-hydroxybenzoate polyprenyltransferase